MRDCMMWAQLRDNNQGIIKITSGGVAPGSNTTTPVIENDSPSGARVNGNQTMSMVVVSIGALAHSRATAPADAPLRPTHVRLDALGELLLREHRAG